MGRGYVSAVLILVLMPVGLVRGGGDPIAGKARAGVCFTCHGADGVSEVPQYPSLAGQHELYLANALRAYKNGQRSDPTMKSMVAPLSDADIDNLAAYFASLDCRP